MASYEFLTTWCFQDAPINQAFDLLRDTERFPQWWTGVKGAEVLKPGNAQGLGGVTRFDWRSVGRGLR